MNIAFSTFILVWILLPGIVYNISYNIDPVKEVRFKTDFGSLIVWSIIPGIIIQFLGVTVITLLGYDINFTQLGFLLIGTKDDLKTEEIFKCISQYKNEIFIYFICSILIAKFFAYIFLKIVWNFRLDLKFNTFRFKNRWFYTFYNRPDTVIDLVGVNATVDTGGMIIEYDGILSEYYFKKNDDLDTVVLDAAVRRINTGLEKTEFEEIQGKLILKYDDLKSLQVSGMIIKEIEESDNEKGGNSEVNKD